MSYVVCTVLVPGSEVTDCDMVLVVQIGFGSERERGGFEYEKC